MNMLTLILIVAAIMFIVLGWTLYGFYKDHKVAIQHIRSCRKHAHKKDALCIDYWRMDPQFTLSDHANWMDHSMKWVPKGDNPDDPYEGIYREGYMSADKWMTNLRYFGVPVFVRIHNFKVIDPRTMDEKEIGYPRNQLTSSIMYNIYKAKTIKKYIDSLTKLKFAEMDIKAWAFLIPIILGIGVAAAYFLLGGF